MSQTEPHLRPRGSLSPFAAGEHYIVTDSGCWEWTGARDHAGYGLIIGGPVARERRAHRASHALEAGPIEIGMHIHHRCENPPCINPDHLERHTHSAHMRLHQQANSALTWDLVREIRARAWEGESVKDLAAEFCLSLGTIHPLIAGRTWPEEGYERPTWTRACIDCGSVFQTHRPDRKYCCGQHRTNHNRRLKMGWQKRVAA